MATTRSISRNKTPKPIPALQNGASLKTPKPIPALKSGEPAKTRQPQSGMSPKAAKPIPGLAARQPTRLQSAPVKMQTESGYFQADGSYQVTRVDGSDTGLAITPRILQDDNGAYKQDDSAWNVTHIGTGTVISGPYKSTEQARSLATKLAPLRWTAPQVPAGDIERAKRVVEAFDSERGSI